MLPKKLSGMAMGRELCMERIILPREKAVFPVIRILPTFTLGPSLMLNVSFTALVPGRRS